MTPNPAVSWPALFFVGGAKGFPVAGLARIVRFKMFVKSARIDRTTGLSFASRKLRRMLKLSDGRRGPRKSVYKRLVPITADGPGPYVPAVGFVQAAGFNTWS